MKQIDNIVSCHEYYHIKEDYTQEDFIYANKKAIENPTIADSTTPIQFNHLVSLEQFDIWMYESLKLRTTMNKVNLEPEKHCTGYYVKPCDRIVNSEPEDEWWENKSNFPCIITTGSDCQMMAWVHYCIDGIAYDCRNNGYRLVKHSNWRRATKEEILANIKGL